MANNRIFRLAMRGNPAIIRTYIKLVYIEITNGEFSPAEVHTDVA
jgi:hypothetical protein